MPPDPDPDDSRSPDGGERDASPETPTPEGAPGFFPELVEEAGDAVVTVDRDRTIRFANPAVRRVFGYDPDDLVDEPRAKLVPEEAHDPVERRLEEEIPTGGAPGIRIPGRHRNGTEIDLSATFATHDHDGDTVVSGIFRNVTDRVERERELRRRNEQLERFASIVTHDLRDPLNTARAKLTLARETGDTSYLTELEDIHDRMAQIIDDVLTLTREDESVGETEPVDLQSVATAAWDTVGAEAVDLAVEGDLRLSADEDRLRTLLENLFANAVRHGDQTEVRIGPLRDDSTGFYVADDGPGIPDEERPDVFEYGYTTADDGTGLGLSIVREIAEAHGWKVRIEDTTSGGARFVFDSVDRT